VVHKNLIPGLGHIVLNKLTGDQISQHYTNALKNGRVDGKGGLAPRTVKFQHIILGKALRHAIRKALLVRNPLDGVAPPHAERPRIRPLDLAQSAQMLDKARGTRLFIPLLLALTCGLRRGEILALRWSNVDLDAATLTVSESMEQTKAGIRAKAPKGERGRVIDLSEMTVDNCASTARSRRRTSIYSARCCDGTRWCTPTRMERRSPRRP
jgi:integrase